MLGILHAIPMHKVLVFMKSYKFHFLFQGSHSPSQSKLIFADFKNGQVSAETLQSSFSHDLQNSFEGFLTSALELFPALDFSSDFSGKFPDFSLIDEKNPAARTLQTPHANFIFSRNKGQFEVNEPRKMDPTHARFSRVEKCRVS